MTGKTQVNNNTMGIENMTYNYLKQHTKNKQRAT